ncbi:hypothetical protein [Halostagnicola sp. GCM10023243]
MEALASGAVGSGHLLALAAVAVSLGEPVPALGEFGGALPSEYVVLGLTLLGVVLLGAIPALLFVRWRLVSPALVVAAGSRSPRTGRGTTSGTPSTSVPRRRR